MNIREINDDNALIEVYLHWFLKLGNCEIDRMGYVGQNENFGIYFIWDKKTEKYCILTTDWVSYNDKRIKKPMTRYKKSTVFFYPIEDQHNKLNEETFAGVIEFVKGTGKSPIYFCDSEYIEFIQDFLKNS